MLGKSHTAREKSTETFGVFLGPLIPYLHSPYICMCKQALWSPWQKQVNTQKIIYSVLKMKGIREHDSAFQQNTL